MTAEESMSRSTARNSSCRARSSAFGFVAVGAGVGHRFARRRTGSAVVNGFEVLRAQHREVEALFGQYAANPDDAIARQVREKLTQHTQLEERALYPELRRLVDSGDDFADEAEAEHALAQTIIARMYDSPPEDLRPLMQELERVVTAHVRTEEDQLFPAMVESGVDAERLASNLGADAGVVGE
jgi:hemerythrin superfamily protein